MSTAGTVRAWSNIEASNNTADSNITSADTQSPDTLDNNIRTIMAAVKKQMNDIGGALGASGTANALTLTTFQVLEAGQITTGLRLLVKAAFDNTSATVTFAPDGLTAANIKRADGSALAVGSIKSGMWLDLVYDGTASEWRCSNIAPAAGVSTPGLVYLTSGTVAAATLDIVLTAYTQYRGLQFVLSGMLPATDGATFFTRFSTDGGSNYLSAASYKYAGTVTGSDGLTGAISSTGTTAMSLTGATGVGNASTEGLNLILYLLNQTSTAFYTRAKWSTSWMDDAATSRIVNVDASGVYAVAQDTDAIRFAFSAGNISAGNYAVYGVV